MNNIDYDKIIEESCNNVKSKLVPIKVELEFVDFNVDIIKNELGTEKVSELVERAEGIIVETDADARNAVSTALSARKLGKEISKLRKEITEPALSFQKRAIAVEKEYISQLENVESGLFEKVEVYQTQRRESLEASGITDYSFENLKTDLGSCSTRSYFEFKIVDESLVPREYFKLDSVKLNEDIKNGIREIPGLEIQEIFKKQYRLSGKK